MTQIKVTNPYYENTYTVKETQEYIENMLRVDESYILLHKEDDTLVSISPAQLATIEVWE